MELKPSTGMTIKELLKLSDEELLDMLGFVNKLNEFKDNLKEADSLTGKARASVETRIQEMLTPNIYPSEIKYAIQDAKRANKSGKEAMADSSPSSVID